MGTFRQLSTLGYLDSLFGLVRLGFGRFDLLDHIVALQDLTEDDVTAI